MFYLQGCFTVGAEGADCGHGRWTWESIIEPGTAAQVCEQARGTGALLGGGLASKGLSGTVTGAVDSWVLRGHSLPETPESTVEAWAPVHLVVL